MPEESKKGFGYWTILALAIGSVMGTTLFMGPQLIASQLSYLDNGNVLIFAWIILSIIAVYIAACFGELSAMFPKAGGAYEFSKQAYGKFNSFNIAWIAWLFGSMATVLVIVAAIKSLDFGFSDYEILGLTLRGETFHFLIGVGLILLLNLVAYLGVNANSMMLLALAVVMLAIPASIVAGGIPQINLENFQPILSGEYLAVFVILFFMAEAYFGWESATYLAEETRNPTKIIPRALIHATAIIGIVGLLLILTILGLIPWGNLAGYGSPVNQLATEMYPGIVASIIFAGMFLAFMGTAFATVLSLPWLLLALARDKLFLGQFTNIHPKFGTPHYAIMFQTVALTLLMVLAFAEYDRLLQLLTPMAAVLYISMLLAIVVLRRKMPDKERPFKVMFSPAGPVLVSLFLVSIVAGWIIQSPGTSVGHLMTSASLMLFGIPFYLLVELYYDPKMITSVNDMIAYATFFLQKITRSGRSIRKEVLGFFGEDVKGKTVLEFGCGVGTLTLQLADLIGSDGKLYSIHFAKNNIKIAKKRIATKKWETDEWAYNHVQVIHDPDQMNRVHPEIIYADATVSIGLLSYIQDIKKILAELYAIMPTGGKLCIVENTDFFHIIPNVEWLSKNSDIEKFFRDAGFAVRVKRKKGLLWNTVFVQGIKFTGETPYI